MEGHTIMQVETTKKWALEFLQCCFPTLKIPKGKEFGPMSIYHNYTSLTWLELQMFKAVHLALRQPATVTGHIQLINLECKTSS